jgi:mRNA-degrading endonuclease toxin of MazEF toxin-antitoxin module
MSQSTPGQPSPKPRRGELYWVKIPKVQAQGTEFRDTDDGTPHAYVVLSRNSASDRLNSFVGVPISSRVDKANRSFRPLIKGSDIVPSNPANPFTDSVALCDHIREVSIERIQRKAGMIATFALGQIENAVAFLLASDD